ncbi:hypothetical protein [Methylobacterium nodulans]|uniref:Uncharacterized protein n=1 Tax=Methylobacterium nodulans (strain LMG 21967 / CNCM I-2342 / ORS 2060) TaxID=460265 RepID=B8ICS2_METNO|nr:hypothetical protein [Methylobacterium nodulans]ACL57483.1 hypothetical protein Mnod_2513 [Methylobacterium nodulans ORS 2060]
MPLLYGGVPVPYTASWSAEEAFRVDRCAYTGRPAICQAVAPGEGKPRFGKPHSQRQREAIARDLCDLCGRPLRNRTKVSLSHARPRIGAGGLCIMQVEPLLHRECAAVSLQHCPSLKRDVRNGAVAIRQVRRHRPQFAIIDPAHVGEYVPGYVAHLDERIVGHGKVELITWTDRDEAWLMRAAAE